MKHNLNQLHRLIQQNQIRLMQNSPERVWQIFQQRFDNAVTGLSKFPEKLINLKREYLHTYALLNREFAYASNHLIQNKSHILKLTTATFKYEVRNQLQSIRHKLELSGQSLEELSPTKILKRGYALVRKESKYIKSISDINVQDKLNLILSDGNAQVTVDSTEASNKYD